MNNILFQVNCIKIKNTSIRRD